MISRKQEINLQFNQLIDALVLGILLWVAYQIRGIWLVDLETLGEIPGFATHLWMLAVIMPFGPFLLELEDFYNYPLEKGALRSLTQILRAGLWLVLLLGLCVIFLRLEVPSRSVLLLFAGLAVGTLLLKERALAHWYRKRLEKGEYSEPVIVAGEPDMIARLLADLSPTHRLEMRVVEQIDLSRQRIDELVTALHHHGVGRVILCFSRLQVDTVQRAIEACEMEGVEAWLSADFIKTSVAKPTYEMLGRRAMLVFRATPAISWALILKSTFDRVTAAVALAGLAPLFLALALLVRLTSPGPVLFRQKRAGLHGKPFTMLKFRSMVVDAEARRKDLESLNEMQGPVFKVGKDPRVTPLGAWLRRTSLDELPQFLNVLRGEMSLVGPRPLPLYEVENFANTGHRRRLSMKPGLTCLWQIRGRNQVTNFDDWVKMDLEYIDHWSLALDFYILLRTVPVVLLGLGAK